jgi:hypothetical protein
VLIWFKRQLPSLDPKDLLPIGIEATKGAIVCGNGSTPSLLVAEFSKAEGTFGIVQAMSKFDLHKQILSFKFQKAQIRYVENDQFQNPMTTIGRIVQEHIEASRFVFGAGFLWSNFKFCHPDIWLSREYLTCHTGVSPSFGVVCSSTL